MIEAFDEVAGDAAAVEALKAWLLSQKRTSRWPGTVATADAVGVLLGRGEDLLASQELVTVTVGGEAVEPGGGRGRHRLLRGAVRAAGDHAGDGPRSSMTKADKGSPGAASTGSISTTSRSVPAAGREELAIEKTAVREAVHEGGAGARAGREGRSHDGRGRATSSSCGWS